MPVTVWEVERFEGRQDVGRTRPLLVSAFLEGTAGEPSEHREMLLKAIGLPEITEIGLFSEYFGTQLAGEFGIDVPVPAVVNLSAELLEAAADNLRQWGVTLRPGNAVGLELRRGLTPLNRLVPLTGEAQEAEAVRIFAFDMLAQNPDRRVDNPNCGSFRGRLVAYDHEMAFSFLYPIVGAGQPWEVPIGFARQHVFHGIAASAMRRGTIDWQPIKDAIRTVSERVDGLVEFLPDAWRANGERVAAHIADVAAHLEDFENNLQRSLS